MDDDTHITMNMDDDALYWLAAITIVFSLLCGAALIGVQYLADTHFWEKTIAMPFLTPTEITAIKHSVSSQSLLLYGVYSLEAATAVAALLCHLAIPSYHLEPVCLALYFACKTCVYGYWLEKAKQERPPPQSQNPRAKRLSLALSSWLLLYALCAIVACFAHLRGAAPESSEGDSAWGSTRFTIDWPALLLLAMALEWLHCFGFNAFFVSAHLNGLLDDLGITDLLCCVARPDDTAMDSTSSSSLPSESREDMAPQIAYLNIHVMCSLVATISTTVTLAILLSAVQYAAWLAIAVDVLVNALAMFFTHSANREYVDTVLCCKLSTTVVCQRLGLLECSCWCCCAPLVNILQKLRERKKNSQTDEEADDFEVDVDFERMVELQLEMEMQEFTRTNSKPTNTSTAATDHCDSESNQPITIDCQTTQTVQRERDVDSGMLGLLNGLQM